MGCKSNLSNFSLFLTHSTVKKYYTLTLDYVLHVSILHFDTIFKFIQNIEILLYLESFMLIWNLNHDFHFEFILCCFN